MTERVAVVEVGPRDGLQNERATVPAADKVRFVEALADAGLPVVEVTSFVSPKAVPQLADADEVLPAVRRRAGVRYPVLVPNLRGMERAVAAGADAVAVFTAASEGFTRANVDMTIAESLRRSRRCSSRRLTPGCGRAATSRPPSAARTTEPSIRPRWRRWPASWPRWAAPRSRSATPSASPGRSRCRPWSRRWPNASRSNGSRFTFTTPADGRSRTSPAGLEAGVRTFDSSAAGLGGCPFAPGAPGNVATEALVRFLHDEGLETGVDPDAVERAGRAVRERLAA